MQMGRRWFAAVGMLVAVLALAAAGRLGGADSRIMAQDAASPAVQEVQFNQPVTVHEGVCGQTIPDPVHELNSLVPFGQNEGGTYEEVVGSVPGLPVLYQEDSIEGSFDDFGAQPYAIAIHESRETFGTLVACADIGGPLVDGRMVLAIRSLASSGFAGTAIIEEDEEGLKITTYVVPQVNAEPQAQPAGQATPEA
jgi:hypothetical protein